MGSQNRCSQKNSEGILNVNNNTLYKYNMLGSLFLKRSQLKTGLRGWFSAKDMVLMGVGWRQYQDGMNAYNNFKLKHMLSNNMLHSVRDEYTEKKLIS